MGALLIQIGRIKLNDRVEITKTIETIASFFFVKSGNSTLQFHAYGNFFYYPLHSKLIKTKENNRRICFCQIYIFIYFYFSPVYILLSSILKNMINIKRNNKFMFNITKTNKFIHIIICSMFSRIRR